MTKKDLLQGYIIAPNPDGVNLTKTVEGLDHFGNTVVSQVIEEKPLTIYRMVDDSRSTEVMNNQRSVWHFYRNELNLSITDAAYCYTLYLVDVALRRAKFLIKNSL